MTDPTGTKSLQIIRMMNNARVKLPGAIDSALQNEVFNVFDDFLRGSSLWTEDILFQVDTTHTDFDITPSAGQILELATVVNSTGITISAVMNTPGTVSLAQANNQVENFTATVSLTVLDPISPVDGFPNIPDWIVAKYLPGLTDGLIGRMMAHAAKPYSSPQAAMYMQRFGVAIAMANTDRLHAHTQGAQRWRFPKFGGTTAQRGSGSTSNATSF